MKTTYKEVLPFTAFVNQKKAKMALILVAINPNIGGVLLKGVKGTGKSALVRALTNILPPIKVVNGCRFSCDPKNPVMMCNTCKQKLKNGQVEETKRETQIITLPLNSTAEMITGSLDIEETLNTGKKKFQLGILGRANRNILYVDELNLLPDHLIDIILDAMASGWNYVEREGISFSHPSQFIFIGTMNPEEGGLRPQILDRLALSVEVENLTDETERLKVIERNIELNESHDNIFQKHQKREQKLKERIAESQEILPEVKIPDRLLDVIARMCKELKVDGHRPDIVIAKTAKTIAAFKKRKKAKSKDVELASKLALGHRTRMQGELNPPTIDEIKRTFEQVINEIKKRKEREIEAFKEEKDVQLIGADRSEKKSEQFKWAFEPYMDYEPTENEKKAKKARKKGKPGSLLGNMKKKAVRMREKVSEIVGKFKQHVNSIWKKSPSKRMMATRKKKKTQTIPLQEVSMEDHSTPTSGRKIEPPSEVKRVPSPRKLNLPSLRGTKGFSGGRRAPTISKTRQGRVVGYERPQGPIVDLAFGPTIRVAALRNRKKDEIQVDPKDIRVKVRQHRAKAVLSVIFDTSKSMWAYLRRITRALLKFHEYAWRSKDKIGVIEARGERARILLKPTSNKKKIERAFFKIQEGGKTPLASALLESYKMLSLEKRKNDDLIPLSVVITDGLGNVELKKAISKELRSEITYPSQADVFAVTRKFSLANFPLLILNPMHLEEWGHPQVISPTKLLKEIARRTNGKYIGFRPNFTRSEQFTSSKIFEVLREGLQTVLQSRAF